MLLDISEYCKKEAGNVHEKKMNSIFEMFMSKVGMLKNMSLFLATRPGVQKQGDSDDANPIPYSTYYIARQLPKYAFE